MGELTAIGFSPGDSPLHRLDARTKQALLLGLSAVSIWGGIAFLGLVSAALILLGRAAGLSPLRVLRELRYFLLFLLFVFAARTLSLGGWAIEYSAAAAGQALTVCWRLLVVVGMGLLLMATTRISHIRAALVWALRPVPLLDARAAATMVGLVVRFLPLILFQAGEISAAQRARGIERRKNPLLRLNAFIIPLFRRVFLSADELAAAMQARCYTDARTLPELAFRRADALALGLGIVVCLTTLLP